MNTGGERLAIGASIFGMFGYMMLITVGLIRLMGPDVGIFKVLVVFCIVGCSFIYFAAPYLVSGKKIKIYILAVAPWIVLFFFAEF